MIVHEIQGYISTLFLCTYPKAGHSLLLDCGCAGDVATVKAFCAARSIPSPTIVVATHLMEEAERCDVLALLDTGAIVASGSPSELRSEIPGETISIVADQPEELRLRIQEATQVDVRRSGELLRIHQADCQELLHSLVGRFSGEFKTISLGKATLEDVFLARTGHRLAGDE